MALSKIALRFNLRLETLILGPLDTLHLQNPIIRYISRHRGHRQSVAWDTVLAYLCFTFRPRAEDLARCSPNTNSIEILSGLSHL